MGMRWLAAASINRELRICNSLIYYGTGRPHNFTYFLNPFFQLSLTFLTTALL